MNQIYSIIVLIGIIIFTSGCAVTSQNIPQPMSMAEIGDKPSLEASLFISDQAVLGDEAIARILDSSVFILPDSKIALMRFPDASGSQVYGRYYWADESYLKVQQGFSDTIAEALSASGAVREVTPLPSLMTPREPSIPVLREAAVRMQADMLLIFRITSATYSKYRMFAGDTVKAYSTCEVVLLDVRTGIVPFARIVTRERFDKKQQKDLELSETMRRTEEAAATDALQAVAADLVSFMKKRANKEE